MLFERKILHALVAIALFLCISGGSAVAFSSGPPDEKTGAPNEGSCSDNYCHVGNDLNAPNGALTLEFPEVYLPNEVYTIVVNLVHPEQSRWGFEMTALDEKGASAGSFKITDAENTQVSMANSKQYIKQTSAGAAQGKSGANQWTVEWSAPDADIGPITFYGSGNAANADFGPSGDYIYTTQGESKPSIPIIVGVTLEGEIEKTTRDALMGVNYILKVTNTGNMKDTFTLENSAEVGNLSESTIELEAGTSAEVTLHVKGDAFTEPGDYNITVTATSKTDSTMASEIVTITTIETRLPEVLPWDVNADRTVDIRDLVLVASHFGQSGEAIAEDINGDGTVDILDLVLVASHFGEEPAAGE